ncbi:MAG TPA: S9 family peptidase [Bacteroidales bacterium]|nr:S9 family peptidase [Bacteroidales bacterium]
MMKYLHTFVFSLILVMILSSCTESVNKEPLIGKKELKLATDRMTPEVLWSFGRVGEFEVSPDLQKILFSITYYDIDRNKSNRELYLIGTDGKNLKQITKTPENEFNYTWRPDGQKILFAGTASGSVQVWEMNPDGSGRKQLTDIPGGISGFKFSADMKKIAYSAEVNLDDQYKKDLFEGLPLTSGKVYHSMMFRHWDEWRDTYSHLFIADFQDGKLSNVTDILEGEPFDFPNKPFGGMEQMSWHPDGKKLAYSCHKNFGKAYAVSTNTDIFIYDLETRQQTLLTRDMKGYDNDPVFSPDGRHIAWTSMERDGYEADKSRLMVFDLESNSRVDYTGIFDNDAEGPVWADDSQSIYFVAYWYGSKEIFNLHLNGTITQLSSGVHDFTAAQPAGDKIIASMTTMSMPAELFAVPAAGGKETQITFTNKDILDQLSLGKVEKRFVNTTDGKKMLTWVIYPPHFDERNKYPALLYCQGGPQNALSQFWSYRWNFQMMAANDYIVVAPNRRGVPGFGQAWKEQISGDYGGQNMQDLLAAIDDVSNEGYVDKDRLGAVGASYGGFSVYWLAGHHERRFKAFIAHDGMFNIESAYLETEEQWFPNFDLGGAPWEKDNPVVQKSYANSPHLFIEKWDTPILVCHSEKDYRVVATQGIMAFNAAQLMGVPSQLLYFPDENHWVLKPQNGILWQRTFFAWLDNWLKRK